MNIPNIIFFQNTDIFSVLASVSTVFGMFLSLGLVIILSIYKKYKDRNKSMLLLNGIIVELVVFIKNYFQCSITKYQLIGDVGIIRVNFKTIAEFEPNMNIYKSIEHIEDSAVTLSKKMKNNFSILRYH